MSVFLSWSLLPSKRDLASSLFPRPQGPGGIRHCRGSAHVYAKVDLYLGWAAPITPRGARNDSHEAVGLENDYKLTKKGNRDPRDSFENWLTDLFDNAIGRPALENMRITYEEVDGQDVCRIDVRPSRNPIYTQGKQTKDFYVRLNNGTRSH